VVKSRTQVNHPILPYSYLPTLCSSSYFARNTCTNSLSSLSHPLPVHLCHVAPSSRPSCTALRYAVTVLYPAVPLLLTALRCTGPPIKLLYAAIASSACSHASADLLPPPPDPVTATCSVPLPCLWVFPYPSLVLPFSDQGQTPSACR
jgi:hypothetical protein